MNRLRIFCTTLFTNNNIKVVIQMHSFQFDLFHNDFYDDNQIEKNKDRYQNEQKTRISTFRHRFGANYVSINNSLECIN